MAVAPQEEAARMQPQMDPDGQSQLYVGPGRERESASERLRRIMRPTMSVREPQHTTASTGCTTGSSHFEQTEILVLDLASRGRSWETPHGSPAASAAWLAPAR